MQKTVRSVCGAAIFCMLLAGCGGGTGGTNVPSTLGAATTSSTSDIVQIDDSALPSPPTSADAIERAPLVQLKAAVTSTARATQMIFGPAFNDTVGWKSASGGPYTGAYGMASAYPASSVPLFSFGSNAPREISIDAPVTRAPNGSCYDLGSFYFSSVAGSGADLVVTDLCASPQTFAVNTPIDATFLARYVRRTPSHPPSYVFLVISFQPPSAAAPTWYAALYDFTTASWDVIATRTGRTGDATGASEYRAVNQYATSSTSACNSGDPVMRASAVALFDPSRFAFDPATPTMRGTTLVPENGATGGCFATAAYSLTFLTRDSDWQVTDLH